MSRILRPARRFGAAAALASASAFASQPALASPFAYVANEDGSSVSIVDLATNRIRAEVPLGGEPEDVAVSSDGLRAYFATNVGLVVFDTLTLQPTTIALPNANATSIAIEHNGNRVFVGHRSSSDLSVYRVATGQVSTQGMPHTAIRRLAMSPLGDFLWAATDGGDIDRLDVRTNVSSPVFAAAMPRPSGLAVDGFGSVWSGSTNNRNVKVFSVNPNNGSVGSLLTISNNVVPGRLGVDRAGGFGSVALVPRTPDDRIDRWWGAVVNLPRGSEPVAVAASADRVIVTANDASGAGGGPGDLGSISIIPPTGPQTHLPGGDEPSAVAIGPTMWADIGAAPASVSFSYFGSVTRRQTITITPKAYDDLQIAALRFAALSSALFSIQNDGCSNRRVYAGSSCTVDVVFTYTQPGGIISGRTYTATLEVPSNARNAPVKTVPLTARYGLILSLGGR